MGGIYCIRCIVNNKRYVGSTINFEKRRLQHFRILKINKHSNNLLQEDFNKHGEENFIFEILETVTELELLEDLVNIENWYMDNYKTHIPTYGNNFGYNKAKAFRLDNDSIQEMKNSLSKKMSGNNHPMFGKNQREESKNRMSKTQKEKIGKLTQVEKKEIYGKQNKKLTDKQYNEIILILKENTNEKIGEKDKKIAILFNVSERTISNIRRKVI